MMVTLYSFLSNDFDHIRVLRLTTSNTLHYPSVKETWVKLFPIRTTRKLKFALVLNCCHITNFCHFRWSMKFYRKIFRWKIELNKSSIESMLLFIWRNGKVKTNMCAIFHDASSLLLLIYFSCIRWFSIHWRAETNEWSFVFVKMVSWMISHAFLWFHYHHTLGNVSYNNNLQKFVQI